jgi:hypothetical protein
MKGDTIKTDHEETRYEDGDWFIWFRTVPSGGIWEHDNKYSGEFLGHLSPQKGLCSTE